MNSLLGLSLLVLLTAALSGYFHRKGNYSRGPAILFFSTIVCAGACFVFIMMLTSRYDFGGSFEPLIVIACLIAAVKLGMVLGRPNVVSAE